MLRSFQNWDYLYLGKEHFVEIWKKLWRALTDVCIKSFEIFSVSMAAQKEVCWWAYLYESEAPLIVFAADRLKWISEVKIINHHHHNNSHLPWALLVQYVCRANFQYKQTVPQKIENLSLTLSKSLLNNTQRQSLELMALKTSSKIECIIVAHFS